MVIVAVKGGFGGERPRRARNSPNSYGKKQFISFIPISE